MKCQGCYIHTADSIYKLPCYVPTVTHKDIVVRREISLCPECEFELAEFVTNNFNGEKK